MAKLTLLDLANLSNETSAVNSINSNNTSIETALENTLSRDGTSPNTMGAVLDMNNNKILNLPDATSEVEPMPKSQIRTFIESYLGLGLSESLSSFFSTSLFPDSTKKYLGLSTLGSFVPSSQLEIIGDSTVEDCDVRIKRFDDSGLGGVVHGMNAGGTLLAPTATPSGALVLGMGSRAYDGTVWQDHSNTAIHFKTVGTQSPTNWGGKACILVTPENSVTRKEAITFDSSGSVFIGASSTPGSRTGDLTITRDDGGIADVVTTSYNSSSGGQFHGYHARGTIASPTPSLSADVVSGYGSRSWLGSNFATMSGASIHFVASQNHGLTSAGTYTQLKTTPNNSITPIERVVVSQDGTLWSHDSSANWNPINTVHTKPVNDTTILSSGSAESGMASNSIGVLGYGLASVGFRGLSARGTINTPTATTTNDFLCFMGGHGYDGTAFTGGTKCLIGFKASENWSGTANGTFITFETTNPTTTSRSEKMRVLDNGQVGIGTSVPTTSTKLHVTGPIKIDPVLVANLPSAATVGAGTRSFVSDSTVTVFATAVMGGGANNIPVYSDGTVWRVG